MTRAERNEKLHQEAIAREVGRRYGKLTVMGLYAPGLDNDRDGKRTTPSRAGNKRRRL